MTTQTFEKNAKTLIDDLKGVCANYGLGNDGNEFKIITQVFLYKFLNDKFAYSVKEVKPELQDNPDWIQALKQMPEDDYEMLKAELPAGVAELQPGQLLEELFHQQDKKGIAQKFDDTLMDIASQNSDIFSVKTEDGAKIYLFDRVTEFITSKQDEFCKALLNKLVHFSFERIFGEKYDFYAHIFEYLIKDYNKDSGGKYAEYYTPHAVAKIMARCLVTEKVQSVTCYDPGAGSGTLLMNLAHEIGEQKCTIYSQDISQKSSNLLRLNLILNDLTHSIPNIIQGNTISDPYHLRKKDMEGRFDYIVSNPPFKLDFSDYRDTLDSKENHERFFAGIPRVPKSAKDKMAIYLLFIQHIMHSLNEKGKAAIVVPTGFITAQSGIDKKIRQRLVEERMLAGVVSMPSNIFATTGTNVSILFLDKTNTEEVVLVDASGLGKKVKDGKNQKTLLSTEEEDRIIEVFNSKRVEDDFSVVVPYEELKAKNYSLSAGQYFEVKIEYVDITEDEFEERLSIYQENLESLFEDSRQLESTITTQLRQLNL